MVRLPPVLEDPQLSEADALHARYLVKSYAEAIRNSTIGAEAHEENPASPWYTEKGMRAAKKSDVSYWQEAKGPVSQPVGEPVARPRTTAGRDALGVARLEHRRMGRNSISSP